METALGVMVRRSEVQWSESPKPHQAVGMAVWSLEEQKEMHPRQAQALLGQQAESESSPKQHLPQLLLPLRMEEMMVQEEAARSPGQGNHEKHLPV